MPGEEWPRWKITPVVVPITMTGDLIRGLIQALQMIAEECRTEEPCLGASRQERALLIAEQALKAARDAGYGG